MQRQAGVALVTALLVVSIAVVLAAALVDQLYLDIRRTENVVQGNQAYDYALSMEEFARFLLRLDAQSAQTSQYDDKTQLDFANSNLAQIVEGGQVISNLSDLQARFNLNNLSKTNSDQARAIQQFQRLLDGLGLDPNLVWAVVDWIDSDQLVDNATYGAEFDYYIGLQTPYRSADTLMTSPSELRLVKGFNNAEIYDQVIDYVSALPDFLPININTAPAEVINSLDGIESADTAQILLRRDGSAEPNQHPDQQSDGTPFENLGEFENYMKTTLNKPNFSTTGNSVGSDYFLLTTTARVGSGKVLLYSILQRDAQGNSKVIGRSQGAW
jgi:general secretion pathway protein K